MRYGRYIKRIAICLLSLLVLAGAVGCSRSGADGAESEEQIAVYIIKTELIDGELIVSYSDGRVENLGPISSESDSDSLSFYPLPDGTYGITAGNTIYLEGISIPEKYKGKVVSTILNDAFKGNENLKTVTIPESVVNIGASAFFGCINLEKAHLPSGLESIGASAFNGCEGLTEINIPETVKEIGSQAFYMCGAIDAISLPDTDISIGGSAFFGTAYYDNEENREGGVLYVGKHLIDAKNLSDESYAIKDGTVTVANYAFSDCDVLKDISVADTLLRIGDAAFMGCSSLSSVDFGDISVLTGIGASAFSNCTALTEITIPDGVTKLQDEAFKGCAQITKINIPDSLESIGVSAFEDCERLVRIELNADNSRLSQIGDGAFRGCSSLAEVKIPLTVEKIGKSAFAECVALSQIYYSGTEKEWKKNVEKGNDWNKNVPEKNIVFKTEESLDTKNQEGDIIK